MFVVIKTARVEWGEFTRERIDSVFDTRRAAAAHIREMAAVEGRTFRIEEWSEPTE